MEAENVTLRRVVIEGVSDDGDETDLSDSSSDVSSSDSSKGATAHSGASPEGSSRSLGSTATNNGNPILTPLRPAGSNVAIAATEADERRKRRAILRRHDITSPNPSSSESKQQPIDPLLSPSSSSHRRTSSMYRTPRSAGTRHSRRPSSGFTSRFKHLFVHPSSLADIQAADPLMPLPDYLQHLRQREMTDGQRQRAAEALLQHRRDEVKKQRELEAQLGLPPNSSKRKKHRHHRRHDRDGNGTDEEHKSNGDDVTDSSKKSPSKKGKSSKLSRHERHQQRREQRRAKRIQRTMAAVGAAGEAAHKTGGGGMASASEASDTESKRNGPLSSLSATSGIIRPFRSRAGSVSSTTSNPVVRSQTPSIGDIPPMHPNKPLQPRRPSTVAGVSNITVPTSLSAPQSLIFPSTPSVSAMVPIYSRHGRDHARNPPPSILSDHNINTLLDSNTALGGTGGLALSSSGNTLDIGSGALGRPTSYINHRPPPRAYPPLVTSPALSDFNASITTQPPPAGSVRASVTVKPTREEIADGIVASRYVAALTPTLESLPSSYPNNKPPTDAAYRPFASSVTKPLPPLPPDPSRQPIHVLSPHRQRNSDTSDELAMMSPISGDDIVSPIREDDGEEEYSRPSTSDPTAPTSSTHTGWLLICILDPSSLQLMILSVVCRI
jgi:hypothetical protein